MDDEQILEATITDTSEKKNNQPLKIDFDELFGPDHEEPAEEIVVVPSNRRRKRRENERKSATESSENADNTSCGAEDLSAKSDHELKELIDRNNTNLKNLAHRLPDKGEKLKAKTQCFAEELERRRHRREQEDAIGYKKPTHHGNSITNGSLDGHKPAVLSSESTTMSSFASSYMKKLEDKNPKPEYDASNQANNAFDTEFSHLSRCDKSKRKSSEKIPQGKRTKPGLGLKGFSPWKPGDCSPGKSGKFMHLNGKRSGKVPFLTGALPLQRNKIADSIAEKDDSQALKLDGLEIGKTVVLVDEEDPELSEKKEDATQLSSRHSEDKIYYPSREDPESLEIFRSELKCLEPGECLTSTIMNFYIRYLQEMCSSTDTSKRSFYFFNTYFYSKLQEAVACQISDKGAFFMKFRRWWKGVNLFQKAYILLPINDDNHWSLVIICIPDKEGESGPAILHLDSLGLHSSSSIINNIKSLLKYEWEILNEDSSAGNVPIPDRIWKYLPRRIEYDTIAVPRQTNDFDCGLFVLYYMECFIHEAPDRLSWKDLPTSPMFGKTWFKPREASSLRGRIKKILQDKFYNPLSTWEPVSLTSKTEAKSTDEAGIS